MDPHTSVYQVELADRFRALHAGPEPLLMANAWDAGSARLLASMGFLALGTTSSAFAASQGRVDGTASRDEAVDNAAAVVRAAADVPVSADLENGYGDDPDDVAETVRQALGADLAGCSVEDWTGRPAEPFYDLKLAAERVAAAASVAHGGPARMVLTARAENHFRGRDDLADTIARLQAYQEAGADVLFAPGLTRLADIRTVVSAVDLPVNVLALPGTPSAPKLAAAGVRRVSVGGGLAYAALGALMNAARELLDAGTYSYWDRAWAARTECNQVFGELD